MLQCNYVEKDNRYSHDPPPGIPRVSPEVIKAAGDQPSHDFDDDFKQLQRENPHLAQRLFVEATKRSRDAGNPGIKRAFAQGALYLYGLLSAEAESQHLKELFLKEPIGDDADGEDLPLSA